MDIKFPVHTSLPDETLIVDRENAEIATTFFGNDDYDINYERRASDASFIAACLNERASLLKKIESLTACLTRISKIDREDLKLGGYSQARFMQELAKDVIERVETGRSITA